MTPVLDSIEAAADATYVVTVRRGDGRVVASTFRVIDAGGIPLTQCDPDIFIDWEGDAESVRRVSAAVIAFDRARAFER